MSNFDMNLIDKTLSFKLNAISETLIDPQKQNPYRIDYSAKLLDGFMVVYGYNKQDAKERFIAYANKHNFMYGNIKTVEIQNQNE